LNESFPKKHVIFIYRPSGYAIWWGGKKGAIFREESFGCDRAGHVVVGSTGEETFLRSITLYSSEFLLAIGVPGSVYKRDCGNIVKLVWDAGMTA